MNTHLIPGDEREARMKSNLRTIALSGGIVVATAIAVHGQTGLLMKAVGGYSFEQAAKEAPDTKSFHSRDGKLTFAIITHTAGNGFFDPTYVGAKVAADDVGNNLVMLRFVCTLDHSHV